MASAKARASASLIGVGFTVRERGIAEVSPDLQCSGYVDPGQQNAGRAGFAVDLPDHATKLRPRARRGSPFRASVFGVRLGVLEPGRLQPALRGGLVLVASLASLTGPVAAA